MDAKIENYLKIIDSAISGGKYKDDWESLSEYPVPEWYKEAKLGAFIHWGLFSVPEYFNEWYERLMYYRGNPIHIHHVRKYGKDFDYSKFIDLFKAEKFDAADLVGILADAGMKYIMPVAEHHDGFKMYKSGLSKWNASDMGPERDILGEIKAECERRNVKFACSSHRAEHFWFANGARTIGYDNEVLNPEFEDFYGPAVNVNKKNGLINFYKRERGITPTKEWLENWLAHTAELIDRYRPETLFFDWWVSNKAFRPYMKKFLAYYFNRSLEWGKEVCVQYKSDAIMYNASIYDVERGRLANTSPRVWQSETAMAKNAWSYTPQNRWKKPRDILAAFVDAISKNGNFVLNVGPRADGSISKEESEILKEIARFMKINAPAIWGTSPWKVFGEGRKAETKSFVEKNNYSYRDFRYTYRPCRIYAFAMKPSKKGIYRLRSLREGRDSFDSIIKGVKILGYENKVEYTLTKKYLKLEVEGKIGTEDPVCFEIEID
jgi:Alpha-L-fucosidase